MVVANTEAPRPPGTPSAARGRTLRREVLQQGAVFAVLMMLGITFTVLSPYFLTGRNMSSIGAEVAAILIVSLGMTFVMIAGEIDVSVGGIFCVAGTILAKLMEGGMPAAFALLITVLIGMGIGLINGIIVVKANVSSLLVTLGMMTLLEGWAVALSNAITIPVFNDQFTTVFGTGTIMSIPNPVWITLLVLAVSYVALGYTKFGWDVYATGGGRDAARLAGVPTNRIRVSVLVLSGGLAALASAVLTARLSAGVPTAGVGLELSAIAAVVVGGTSFLGGRGGVILTVLGALLLVTIINGLTLVEVDSSYQQMVKGGIIIAAVVLDQVARR
jgi:ribose transport system permease protein